MDSTYTDANYLDECKALDENPRPKPKDFETFATQCSRSGLSARWRHDTHWQIQKAGTAIVDFWPTANKVRPCQCKNKEKARRGNAADAIALAVTLAAGKPKAGKSDEPRLRRERIATAMLVALVGTVEETADAAPVAAAMAEDACILADALISKLDNSEVTP